MVNVRCIMVWLISTTLMWSSASFGVRYLCNNADPVRADDGDNGFHVSFLLCADMEKGPCDCPLCDFVCSASQFFGYQLMGTRTRSVHRVAFAADGNSVVLEVLSSPTVAKSTVMQYGVPISSSRR